MTTIKRKNKIANRARERISIIPYPFSIFPSPFTFLSLQEWNNMNAQMGPGREHTISANIGLIFIYHPACSSTAFLHNPAHLSNKR